MNLPYLPFHFVSFSFLVQFISTKQHSITPAQVQRTKQDTEAAVDVRNNRSEETPAGALSKTRSTDFEGLVARFPVHLHWPPSVADYTKESVDGRHVGNRQHQDLELFHNLHGTGGEFRQ